MRRVIVTTLCSLTLAGMAASAHAQPAALDTASLASGPYARMHTLLEKTLLKVDVLTLDIHFGEETARRIAAFAADGRSDEMTDSIADVAARATDAFARIRFQRGVGLGQFLGGIRDNLKRARAAGYIDAAQHDEISNGLPGWYAFLDERGIEEGDVMLYRVSGDELRVVYIANDGRTLLDRTDPGAHRRLAVLGSYFAPGSDFRNGLIRSVFQ